MGYFADHAVDRVRVHPSAFLPALAVVLHELVAIPKRTLAAVPLLRQALALDSSSAPAAALLGFCQVVV
jgi:tetratricopeptide (TPR) repeat protein